MAAHKQIILSYREVGATTIINKSIAVPFRCENFVETLPSFNLSSRSVTPTSVNRLYYTKRVVLYLQENNSRIHIHLHDFSAWSSRRTVSAKSFLHSEASWRKPLSSVWKAFWKTTRQRTQLSFLLLHSIHWLIREIWTMAVSKIFTRYIKDTLLSYIR